MTEQKHPRAISLFTGCGGLDLGFHMAGYRTVWANDIASAAVETFRRNLGNVIVEGDVEKINPYNDTSIPDCDLVLGGFPCQDFSLIWKRPGLNGDRGNLYKSFLRFVDAKKPKAFVAENVKGLLSVNNRKAIQQIIGDFESIMPGYLVQPHVYNFAEYGVPQFRERLLIVGVRMDTGFHFAHPWPTHGPRSDKPYVTAGEAIKNAELVEHNSERPKVSAKTRQMLSLIPEGGNFKSIPKDHPLYVKGMISHVYRRLKLDEPARTIIAAGGGGTWGYHFPETRALSNRERARLQSFPDDFIFHGSMAEVRKQIGNAVPPRGVYATALALKPMFTNSYTFTDLYEIQRRLKTMTFAERIAAA